MSFPSTIIWCFLYVRGCATPPESIPDQYIDPVAVHYDSSLKPFYHGMASGAPLPRQVVLWTRVTPERLNTTIEGEWEMAGDEGFSAIARSGKFATDAGRDYTVKIDVGALEPDPVYYYRFKALGQTSITGRTKTTPLAATDSLQFAVVSCGN